VIDDRVRQVITRAVNVTIEELEIMKRKPERQQKPTGCTHWPTPLQGGCPGKGRGQIVNPGAYTEAVYTTNSQIFTKPMIKIKLTDLTLQSFLSLKNEK
jgi:hypothetical protein